ncbi:MAG: 5-formyltetrahydrofolate cyclo-ligase [Bdellovibrionales bacterium]|nr:5-formyltetrahydrofolate cyclo-ligase [Bdellovibrionales bacterium]
MEALSTQTVKADTRRRFREARQKFTAAQGREVSAALSNNLKRLLKDLVTPETQVALYRALPEEASAVLEPMTDYFFPRIRGETLEFRKPLNAHGFELNSFKIPEPIEHSSQIIDVRRPLLVCCPAVAVDWQGGRIGMGKGYYDRFFDEHPHALRVGVVYQIQVSKTRLPAESWDASLDWIVTEKMILRTSDRSL